MSPVDAEPFHFHRRARSLRLAALLVAIWAGLLAIVLRLDAAWWVVGLLALPTLPALTDLIRNPESGIDITAETIRWHSGRHRGEVALTEIDHIRMDTRWDFSVRVRLMLRTGRRLQLPHDALPPHRQLEAVLTARGLRVERHHFTTF